VVGHRLQARLRLDGGHGSDWKRRQRQVEVGGIFVVGPGGRIDSDEESEERAHDGLHQVGMSPPRTLIIADR